MLTKLFKLCFVVLLPIVLRMREGCIAEQQNVSGEATTMNNFTERMSYKIEEIKGSLADMGEGPHWDMDTRNLYYVDLNAGKILRYDYDENKIYRAKVEGEQFASFIIPVRNKPGYFAVGCGLRVLQVQWDGFADTAIVVSIIFEVHSKDERYAGVRFNDAKCDTRGRLFAGTLRYVGDIYEFRLGHLFKYDPINGTEIVKTDCGLSNGLTWNDRTKKFYFADTADFNVKEYDYDIETGKVDIENPRVVLNLERSPTKGNLLPDGMTIDNDGNIYVAIFNNHSVYKVNPETGKILLKIELPCTIVTSVAFGGPNLDILFVTTANQGGLRAPCGSVFKISNLGAQGQMMSTAWL